MHLKANVRSKSPRASRLRSARQSRANKPHRSPWFGVACALVGVALMGGCGGCDDDPVDPADPTSSSSGTGGGGGIDPGPPTSPTANVRFKSGKRLQRELARALDLDEGGICRELGQYECFGIHTVVLGEPEAFGIGLYEALPQTSAVSPLAAERVVLSGCSQRAAADFANPAQAAIFKNLNVDASGKLTSPDDGAMDDAITDLYRRGLSRDPTAEEVDYLADFYTAVEAEGSSTHVARDWATLSCFSVLTTMEALFY